MTTSDSHEIVAEFIEAKNNWELEKLYVDLALTKGKALTPVEKKFLRGLLCGCSPAEIASIVYQSRSSSTVRVYLSNGLYKYIEEMLSNEAGYSVKVKNWSRVIHLLEKAGYKKDGLQLQSVTNYREKSIEQETDLATNQLTPILDWGEAIDVSEFYGRITELAKTQQWIVQEHCRLVVILGMGGIGKTAFSVKLAQEIQEQFDYIIWRSLRLAPPLEVILAQLIQTLSPNSETKITETVEGRISQLIDCLRSSRCLIFLDNFDAILVGEDEDMKTKNSSILNPQQSTGNRSISYILSSVKYNKKYEFYGELIRQIGELPHQSCLVLTSREKPPEIIALEGEKLPVRSLNLTGLGQQESRLIFQAQGFTDISEKDCQMLVNWYAGNPLFIKLVATAIQELFSGNTNEFIAYGTVVFGDIRGILDQQYNRLSQLEKHIMSWLALNQDFALGQLQKNIIPGLPQRLSKRLILEAIELLQRRSLLERQASSFSLTPVVKEYIIERLIEENFKLSEEQEGYLLKSHTIFAAHLKNYMRESRFNAEI